MDDKEFYLDAIRDVVPEHKEEQIQDVFYSFLELEHLYDSAIELVKTQLNIFDNEFSMRFQRNPIHNIESRIKTPQEHCGKVAAERHAGYTGKCPQQFNRYCRGSGNLLLY